MHAKTFSTALLATFVCAHAAPAQPTPKFEVASVTRNIDDVDTLYPHFQGTTLSATAVTLSMLIEVAYGVPERDLFEGPSWIYPALPHAEYYDVLAKFAERSSPADQRTMLRNLLADRFGLRLRRETRQLPVYILTRLDERGRLGPTLRPATRNCLPRPTCDSRGRAGFTAHQGAQWSAVVEAIGRLARERIVDRTGLSGFFDFEVTYSAGGLLPAPGDSGVDIFGAVRQQLGLKLVAGRAPFEITVVEAVNRPTPN